MKCYSFMRQVFKEIIFIDFLNTFGAMKLRLINLDNKSSSFWSAIPWRVEANSRNNLWCANQFTHIETVYNLTSLPNGRIERLYWAEILSEVCYSFPRGRLHIFCSIVNILTENWTTFGMAATLWTTTATKPKISCD